MIANVCQATGWTWDHVENDLTIVRLAALRRFWQRSPPPHVLLKIIAEGLGWRPAGHVSQDDPWDNLRELGADPASGIAIRGKVPL